MTFSIFLENLLASLTVLGQVLSVVLILLLAFNKTDNRLIRFVRAHGMTLAFIVVGIAVCGSLSYSDILGLEPCRLCWYQRIFMYPQLIILGMGMMKSEYKATLYALVLSIFGLPIALYHYLIQRGVLESGCSVVGNYSVSCSKYFHMSYGYITIPLMAFTAFFLNILFLVIFRAEHK